ncbi:hypothetical protein M569_09587, partial [Genlisea aurea]
KKLTFSEDQNFDRNSELTAFDETKSGVKGLVDAGITRVPKIFHSPPDAHEHDPNLSDDIPVIDLDGIHDPDKRNHAVDEIREACRTWGFFQIVNHGIPVDFLDRVLEGVRGFFEQDDEVKGKWYTRDLSKTVVYNSNFDLYRADSANWRDTAYCNMAPINPNPQHLPPICREMMVDYSKEAMNLGRLLFNLLSEALRLNPSHLEEMGCTDGLALLLHYYPSCPEPQKTLGATKHSDYGFLTVLVQDRIGGLQVLHRNRWIDVRPVPGALTINVGDFLQLISNDEFKSSQHRVVANRRGPRVSVACFFTTGVMPSEKEYGPIEELVS